MAEQTFDPRFDPAFQRGYVPPAKPQLAPSAPLPADSIGEPPAGPDPRQAEEAGAEANTESVAERRGVNPYVVILWVVGVLFVAGGAALLFMSYLQLLTSYSAGPSQNTAAQTLYLFGTVFGVPAITVGLATIAGLIFFSAWRSSRRHGGTSS